MCLLWLFSRNKYSMKAPWPIITYSASRVSFDLRPIFLERSKEAPFAHSTSPFVLNIYIYFLLYLRCYYISVGCCMVALELLANIILKTILTEITATVCKNSGRQENM